MAICGGRTNSIISDHYNPVYTFVRPEKTVGYLRNRFKKTAKIDFSLIAAPPCVNPTKKSLTDSYSPYPEYPELFMQKGIFDFTTRWRTSYEGMCVSSPNTKSLFSGSTFLFIFFPLFCWTLRWRSWMKIQLKRVIFISSSSCDARTHASGWQQSANVVIVYVVNNAVARADYYHVTKLVTFFVLNTVRNFLLFGWLFVPVRAHIKLLLSTHDTDTTKGYKWNRLPTPSIRYSLLPVSAQISRQLFIIFSGVEKKATTTIIIMK